MSFSKGLFEAKEAISQKESKDPLTIPKKIHFIWLGGPIPKKYLLTIYHLTAIAQKSNFEINLWVDDENNYRRTATQEDLYSSALRIRFIGELKQKMSEDVFFKEDNRFNKFWAYVLREMAGFKNYAAASDILRVEILRQEGGYYIDTDTPFEFERQNESFKVDEAKYGFLATGQFAPGELTTGNSLMASKPYGKIVEKILSQVMENYQQLDNQRLKSDERNILQKPRCTHKYFITRMDLKRKPYDSVIACPDGTLNVRNNVGDFAQSDHRFNMTLKASGPGSVHAVLREMAEMGVPHEERNIESLNRIFLFKKNSKNLDIVAGKSAHGTAFTLSWIKKTMPSHAFDDNSFKKLKI